MDGVKQGMVEAAGVEPASENAVSQEPTYLVRFLRSPRRPLSPLALRTDKKRKQPACRSRSENPDVAFRASSLCDAVSRPVSKAGDSGYLVN